jgi:hypothetical protein
LSSTAFARLCGDRPGEPHSRDDGEVGGRRDPIADLATRQRAGEELSRHSSTNSAEVMRARACASRPAGSTPPARRAGRSAALEAAVIVHDSQAKAARCHDNPHGA